MITINKYNNGFGFFINSKKQLPQKNREVIQKSHRDFNFITNN